MTPNVTSTPERNSGWGLSFAERLVAANGGVILVRSGTGFVVRGAKNAEGEDIGFPGTLIAMRIRTDTPLDDAKAWQALLGDVTLDSDGDA